jgi:hypothetical protein
MFKRWQLLYIVTGGSTRGSDRSVKSGVNRRDVDDIALSSVLSTSQHHLAAAQPVSSYGRKDIDDMVSST